MRRIVVAVGGGLVASACAVIAGLDDPADAVADEAGTGDTSSTSDATSTNDASPTDGGPPADADADAERSCTGPVLKVDSFEDRTDPAAGWSTSYRGDGGVIEIQNGRLHIYVPPATSGVNARRQLDVDKAAPKHMCATFTVEIVKPQNTTAFFDAGDTVYGFIGVEGQIGDASVSYYEGVGLELGGPFAYVFRAGGVQDSEQLFAVPIATKWHVYMNADFVANTVTLAVNDREATFGMARPTEPVPTATFTLGIRNLGPVPEAEAFFDDVVVTAD